MKAMLVPICKICGQPLYHAEIALKVTAHWPCVVKELTK